MRPEERDRQRPPQAGGDGRARIRGAVHALTTRGLDLVALALAAVSLAAAVALDVPAPPEARTLLALVFVLFAPGYALLALLHPRAESMELSHRLALSFALSLAIVPLLTLVLNYVPGGITLTSSVVAVAMFEVACGSTALVRRAGLAPGDAFTSRIEPPPAAYTGSAGPRNAPRARRAAVALAVATGAGAATIGAAVLLGVFARGVGTAPERFTEFYLLGPSGVAREYPRDATVGQPVRLVVGLANEEGRAHSYRVEARQGDRVLGSIAHDSLAHGARSEVPIEFAPVEAGSARRVEFALYRDADSAPLRTLHILLDVAPPATALDASASGG